jgi:hypothetical protein
MTDADVSGQITDGSDNPIANAEVYLWREDLAGSGGVVASVTADTNGNFAFTEHPDATNSQQSGHVAAEDPNGNVQLQSAYGVTASPFPSFPIERINWDATGDNETGFNQFAFADNNRRADTVQSIGFNGN